MKNTAVGISYRELPPEETGVGYEWQTNDTREENAWFTIRQVRVRASAGQKK